MGWPNWLLRVAGTRERGTGQSQYDSQFFLDQVARGAVICRQRGIVKGGRVWGIKNSVLEMLGPCGVVR